MVLVDPDGLSGSGILFKPSISTSISLTILSSASQLSYGAISTLQEDAILPTAYVLPCVRFVSCRFALLAGHFRPSGWNPPGSGFLSRTYLAYTQHSVIIVCLLLYDAGTFTRPEAPCFARRTNDKEEPQRREEVNSKGSPDELSARSPCSLLVS